MLDPIIGQSGQSTPGDGPAGPLTPRHSLAGVGWAAPTLAMAALMTFRTETTEKSDAAVQGTTMGTTPRSSAHCPGPEAIKARHHSRHSGRHFKTSGQPRASRSGPKARASNC
jgi:hypothetical protein